MSAKIGLLCLVSILLLSACQSADDVTPQPLPPTPEVWTMQLSPTLDWMRDPISSCAAELEHTGVLVVERSAAHQNLSEADLLFRWGEAPELPDHAFELGSDELTFIIHPDLPLEGLTYAQLQNIYQGKIRRWSAVDPALPDEEIQVWVYPDGADAQAVLNLFLEGAPHAAPRYYAPNPAAMIEAVQQTPNAIGFIPSRYLTDEIHPLGLHNNEPLQSAFPILALSGSSLTAEQESFLLCLQTAITQTQP
ncbi:MAG: substrate-binding domain-containing protein [Anaerolineaceae bacterium]|nr:substrate-binding domain-containing protein [Anaerolineaceae bacterium]